MCPKTFHI